MRNLMFIILIAGLAGCVQTSNTTDDPSLPTDTLGGTKTIVIEKSDSVLILEKSEAIINVLKEKRFLRLVPFIHPEKGLRFSPYATVDTADIVVKPRDISGLSTKEVRRWGVFDGSGESMDLTFEDYHQKFIYDYDFADADSIFYNLERQHGNSINNIREIYPDAKTVEFYVSGKEGEYTGFDWRALRLIFEKSGEIWYLSGIVHSEWTI
ncbi:MAG: hypothetical protein AAF502_25390 [Bacteroidota bacterium]